MKKFALFTVGIICLGVVTLSGCGNAYVPRGKTTYTSITSTTDYSYKFPYLTSSKSTGQRQSAFWSRESVSASNSVYAPSLSTSSGVEYLISLIGEVNGTNYLQKEQNIILCEQAFLGLDSIAQSAVANYAVLQEARSNFDYLARYYSTPFIQQFKTQVGALGEPNDLAKFKQRLDDALATYGQIHSSLRAEVATQKTALDNAVYVYDCHQTAMQTEQAFDALDKTVSNQTVGALRAFLRDYDLLAVEVSSCISPSVKEQIETLRQTVFARYSTVYSLVCQDQNYNAVCAINGATKVQGSFGYLGRLLVEGMRCNQKTTVAITAPYGVFVKVYATNFQNATLVLSKGSKRVAQYVPQNNVTEFLLQDASSYSITFEGEMDIFAIEIY